MPLKSVFGMFIIAAGLLFVGSAHAQLGGAVFCTNCSTSLTQGMIDRHFANVNDILRLKKSPESLEREPALIESPSIEVLLARREIFLDAFR